MKGKSATSGGAPWRAIQSRKSSSFSARKPRLPVTMPSASIPRATAVMTATRCHVRRRSASPSTRPAIASAVAASARSSACTEDATPERSSAPRARVAASRMAASTVTRTPLTSGLGPAGASAQAVRDTAPDAVASSGSESRKSTISCSARRRTSPSVSSRLVPSGSPGSRSFGVNWPSQWCQPSSRRSSSPTVARGEERVAPGLDRRRRIGVRAIELGVALAQEAEGVLVVAQPQVQAVLLDPAVRAAAAGPLAAEPPSALVHRDRLQLVAPARLAEAPRRRQAGHAAAEDGDAGRAPAHRGVEHASARLVELAGRVACVEGGDRALEQRARLRAEEVVQVERDPQLEGARRLDAGELEGGAQLPRPRRRGRARGGPRAASSRRRRSACRSRRPAARDSS